MKSQRVASHLRSYSKGRHVRQRFLDAARIDFQDFAMLGDATATLEDGILRLEIDLRASDS